MNVLKIVVDELPESCGVCKFVDWEEDYCIIAHRKFGTNFYYNTRIDWCPLVVEEVCEWVREKTERGFAAFYIPKDHEQHPDCYTQDAGEYKFCPNCGKRIKYIESE